MYIFVPGTALINDLDARVANVHSGKMPHHLNGLEIIENFARPD